MYVVTEIRSFQCHYHADPCTKVFYFEKYFENTILFCIFKILFGVFCTSLTHAIYAGRRGKDFRVIITCVSQLC